MNAGEFRYHKNVIERILEEVFVNEAYNPLLRDTMLH